jgi:peroxiredoxin
MEDWMSALITGKRAPEISLSTMDGDYFTLSNVLGRGPAVLIFFKISCPVCQFALPYFERIYQAAKGKNVTIAGISQNSKKESAFFAQQYGVTYPIALENTSTFAVSNAYGITNVPTVFYVNQEGVIEVSSVGWSRADVEEIARRVSQETKLPPITVIKPSEAVPDFRGG